MVWLWQPDARSSASRATSYEGTSLPMNPGGPNLEDTFVTALVGSEFDFVGGWPDGFAFDLLSMGLSSFGTVRVY